MLLGSIKNSATLFCADYTLNDIQVIKCRVKKTSRSVLPTSLNMKFVQSGMTELKCILHKAFRRHVKQLKGRNK